ncbi:hypothetical protein ACFLWZ_00335 [Chloroflexota bacterium]
MDSISETGMTIILAVLMVGLLVANVYFGKRKAEKAPLGKVVSVLSDIRHNQKIVQTFNFHWQTKRFKAGGWRRNSTKINFLPGELWISLEKMFDLIEDYNQRIDVAKKSKSDSYMAGIDVDRLKSPLDDVAEKLREWVQANMSNPEYAPKRRGLLR